MTDPTSHWDPSARHALESAIAAARRHARDTGADADEVEADLRAHLSSELAAAGIELPSLADVESRVERYQPHPAPDSARSTAVSAPRESAGFEPPRARREPRRTPSFWSAVALVLFGQVLPVLALVIEAGSHMSARSLGIDPLPTPAHVLWILSVPIACAWAQYARPQHARSRRLLLAVIGFALVTALYHALLFLPVAPFALIAVLYVGVGLLPLAPLLSVIGLVIAYGIARRTDPDDARPNGRAFLRGLGAGVLVVVCAWLPRLVLEYAIDTSLDDAAAPRARGAWLLRNVVSESALLERCYVEQRTRLIDSPEGTARFGASSRARARSAFWIATGESFSTRPPPSDFLAAQPESERWIAESEQGGVEIGGRVSGLSLGGSRLDGLLDADALCGYLEWELTFRNAAARPAEARAEILLPSDATVSRFTLWIAGEPREAAFGPRSNVRGAYERVVRVERRDPALITTCGPDRVRLQCYPVPAGGEMRVRVGISVPLEALDAAHASCELPRIVERNFDVAAELPRTLWLRAPRAFELDGRAAVARGAADERMQWSGELTELALERDAHAITLERDAVARSTWAPSGDGAHECVLQTLESTRASARRLVIVVDGSAPLAEHADEIALALRALPRELEVGVIAALDEPRILLEPAAHSADELARALDAIDFVGGRDNSAALVAALERTRESDRVLWLHGPQAWTIAEPTRLLQLVEREDATMRVWTAELAPGRQRLLESLPVWNGVRRLARAGTLADDVARFGEQCAGTRDAWSCKRATCATDALPEGARGPASPHVAKLAQRAHIEQLARGGGAERTRAQRLATELALVTSCSGAVVLERQNQYAENGLTPVDPDSAPSVPEPATLALLAIGVVALLLSRRHANGACA